MNTQHSDEIYSNADNSISISLRKTDSEQFTWTLANLNPERRATVVISPPTPFEERVEITLPPGGTREVAYDNVKPSYRWKIAKMVGAGGLSYEILCDIKMSDIEQRQRLPTGVRQMRTRMRPVVSDTPTTTTPPKRPTQEPARQRQKSSDQLSKKTVPPDNVQRELITISKNSKQLYSELRTVVQNINELYRRQREMCEQTEQFHSQAQQTYHEIVQIRMALEENLQLQTRMTSSSEAESPPPLQARQHQAKSLDAYRRDDDDNEPAGHLTEILKSVEGCKAELASKQIVKSPEAWSIIANFERNVKSVLQDRKSGQHPETLKIDLAYNIVDSVDVLEKDRGQSDKVLEILKKYRRRILAQLDMEIIPIERDKTKVDSRLHNIHSTLSGDYPENAIVEVVQNGIRNATTKKTIRKAAVVRGDAG